MDEVESVATWLGIIVGTAGVVLAVVAIWFAMMVNDRASKVSQQTVQSLQKIETTVERLSEDTTGLIKAAWDKMLGQVGYAPPSEDARSSADEIASGISTEMRAQLAEQPGLRSEEVEKLETLIRDMQATLASQIAAQYRPDQPGVAMERVAQALRGLSPEAQELARAVDFRDMHLTREQYRALISSPLKEAVHELREAGLLAPLSGYSPSGDEFPVYFFPGDIYKVIGAALRLNPDNPPVVKQRTISQLETIGYFKKATEEGS